jgi:hypothetical protein
MTKYVVRSHRHIAVEQVCWQVLCAELLLTPLLFFYFMLDILTALVASFVSSVCVVAVLRCLLHLPRPSILLLPPPTAVLGEVLPDLGAYQRLPFGLLVVQRGYLPTRVNSSGDAVRLSAPAGAVLGSPWAASG